jgi:amidophosphoribosyltransferase
MGEEKYDECGVCGLHLGDAMTDPTFVARSLYIMSFNLQNRGRLSAGLCTYNPTDDEFGHNFKGPTIKTGKVNELYQTNNPKRMEEIFREHPGRAGIGHVRYSTENVSDDPKIVAASGQPFMRRHTRQFKEFVFAFNGHIANHKELRKKYNPGYRFKTGTDTEDIVNLYSMRINDAVERSGNKDVGPDLFEVTREVMSELDGSYSGVVMFSDGNMVIFRDPNGTKPLVYSTDPFIFASESVALDRMGVKNFRDLPPGSCVVTNGKTLEERALFSPDPHHCHFEWVYFANVTSIIEGRPVYLARAGLGDHLADIDPLKDEVKKDPESWIVIAAPKTSIPATEQYAHRLGIRKHDAIIKIEGDRTFINTPQIRDMVIDREFGIIPYLIRGRKVILVDDSFVKGSTLKRLISLIYSCEPDEIHIRSIEPPIIAPCFRGIDMARYEDLIANKFSRESLEEDMAKHFKVRTVLYAKHTGVVNAIGIPESNLCMECINGKYQSTFVKKRADEARAKWNSLKALQQFKFSDGI